MTKFTIYTYTNKEVTYQEVPVRWSDETIATLKSHLSLVSFYMNQLSKPIGDMSTTELTQEYNRLKELHPNQEKDIKFCYSSLRSFLHDDGQIAENFASIYRIPCKTYRGAPVITTKTNCLVRIPDELREIITSQSLLHVLAVITTDGEFKIVLRISNDTPESKLHVPLMSRRFDFLHLLNEVFAINPEIAKEEIANMREALDKIGESK